jgi:hypothetical protein
MNSKTVKILAGTTLLLVIGIVFGCIKRVIPIPPPPSPSSTLKNGLLLYLPFNGSIADSSGNNNPTAIVGLTSGNGGLTTDENGNANSAWGSNGTGTYVRVTNNGSIKYDSNFSVSFNVMVNSNTPYAARQAFLTFVTTSDAYGPGIATGLTVPNYTNYFFGVQDESAGCDNIGSYTSKIADTTSFIPQPGIWYNIVNIYKAGVEYVYINGQLIGTDTNPLNHVGLICPQSTVNVGYWWDQDMESLNGKIDEIRLYNRVLTVDEISALASNTQVTTPPPTDTTVDLAKGLLLYLPFNGSIADSSGNGNPTTATTNVLTYDEHGYANSAFGATGNGEMVYVTNNGSIKFDTAWSLSYGFMVNVNNIQQYFLSMVDPATGEGPSISSGISLGNGINNFAVGSEDVTIGCSAAGRNDNYSIVDTTGLIPDVGAWYNAIAIYHRGSLKVYINGQLVKSRTGLGTLSNWCPSSQIVIGGWWGGQPLNMNGKLDNVRLYNRVLNANEIAALSSSYQITSNSIKATPKMAH